MRSIARFLRAGTFVALVSTAVARADVPSPANSTVPACIVLVGSNGAGASAAGTFAVIHRDLANNPIPGAQIVVDLSNANDMHLCAQQVAPGVFMNCANNRAWAITDANGRATFTLLGSSNGNGPPSTLLNGGRIYANGTLIGSPTVGAYDLDGVSGVGANDLSQWFQDFSTGQSYGRSDYDCSGYLGANDFSFWLTEFGSGRSAISCAASCP